MCRPFKSSHSFIHAIKKEYIKNKWFLCGNIHKCLGGFQKKYLLCQINPLLHIDTIIKYWIQNDHTNNILFLTQDKKWIKKCPYFQTDPIIPIMINIIFYGFELYVKCISKIW